MDKMLYLMRHGNTDSNIFDIVQGFGEHLNERGEAEATLLGVRLKKHREHYPIEAFYVSNMVRAQETAKKISAELNGYQLPFIPSEHLHEYLRPSSIHGLQTSNPDAVAVFSKLRENFHNPEFTLEDGETFSTLKLRCKMALAELTSDPRKHLGVISHGVFLSALVNYALFGEILTSEILARNTLTFPNTGITLLKHKGGRTHDLNFAWHWSLAVADNSHTHI